MATRTYGTVSPEQQRAMSALEFVKGLADLSHFLELTKNAPGISTLGQQQIFAAQPACLWTLAIIFLTTNMCLGDRHQ